MRRKGGGRPVRRLCAKAVHFLLLWSAFLIGGGHSQQSDGDGGDDDDASLQACYNNLYLSDADRDGRVDSQEYVTFVQLEGPPGFLDGVDSFVTLPMLLQSNFYTLACLCSGGDQCCLGGNAHLNATGTAPGETPTAEQVAYLDLVCEFTGRAVDMVLVEEGPPTATPAPGGNETSGGPPTQAPSPLPTGTNGTDDDDGIPAPSRSDAPSFPPTSGPTTTATPTTTTPTAPGTPIPMTVKALYSIVVPLDAPQPTYTPGLISAMDVVAQDVAASLVLPDPDGGDGDGPQQRQLGWRRRGASAGAGTDGDGDVERRRRTRQRRPGGQRQRQQQQPQRRRAEVVVTLPTAIDQILDMGFTDDPLQVGGIFVLGPCPAGFGNATTDLCGQVTASVLLELTGGEPPLVVYRAYLAALNQAIIGGDLGAALSEVDPGSAVSMASGTPVVLPPTAAPAGGGGDSDGDGAGGLSTGAIAGIAVAGCVVLVLAGYAMAQTAGEDPNRAKKRKRPTKADPETGLAAGFHGHGDGPDVLVAVSLSEKLELEKQEARKDKDGSATIAEATTVASTMAASSEEPLPQSNLGQETRVPSAEQSLPEEQKQSEDAYTVPSVEDDSPGMMLAAVPYISPNKYDEPQPQAREFEFANADELGMHDSSSSPDVRSTGGISHESEAGWSEAYTSSMGTMSDDEMLPDVPGQGALSQPSLVMLGATNALEGGPGGGDGTTTADAKMEDLENAIMEGDWIAVGATAAALEKMQHDMHSKSDYSKSTEGVSVMSSLRSDKWKGAFDESKAAELDRLIESGDWEGIILAASNFEGEDSGVANASLPRSVEALSSGDEMDHPIEVHEDNSEDESHDVYSGSHISSKYTPTSDQTEEDTAPKRSKEEIRAEVLELVKQVVPEELDHVDEMMNQFNGRETELLETLITMQERATAQQARYDSLEQPAVGADALKSPDAAAQARWVSSGSKGGNEG